MGATFKENVSDIRNSKVTDVIATLKSYHLNIFVHDPYANGEDIEEEYGIHLTTDLDDDYDAVIVSVPHAPYLKFDDDYFKTITKDHALIADLKGVYRGKITSRKYWSF
jgi:UDP-N-acetyl-D-galactosamine dehydrogenase